MLFFCIRASQNYRIHEICTKKIINVCQIYVICMFNVSLDINDIHTIYTIHINKKNPLLLSQFISIENLTFKIFILYYFPLSLPRFGHHNSYQKSIKIIICLFILMLCEGLIKKYALVNVLFQFQNY